MNKNIDKIRTAINRSEIERIIKGKEEVTNLDGSYFVYGIYKDRYLKVGETAFYADACMLAQSYAEKVSYSIIEVLIVVTPNDEKLLEKR